VQASVVGGLGALAACGLPFDVVAVFPNICATCRRSPRVCQA
jgi:hypothetical protein